MPFQTIGLGQNGNLNQCQRLEDHWNSKLSDEFPLAPVDLVERGIVNLREYEIQNIGFGDFVTRIMLVEIEEIIAEAHNKGVKQFGTEVLGAGLARDLRWLLELLKRGCFVKIHDISHVAQQYVERLYKDQMNSGVQVVIGEIEHTWDQLLGSDDMVIYFASQFIQVQKRRKMQRLMCRLGRILDSRSGHEQLQKRLYLVHPFHSDNNRVVEWHGVWFPKVQWGDTTPYSLKVITNAIEKAGLSGDVRVKILGRHTYFHQVYSFVKVTVIQ